MIIFIALLAFALPLLLRNFLEILQGFMALTWVILLTNMPKTFPTGDFEFTMHRILFITLPMWVFSSLIALSIRSKYVDGLIKEQQSKSNGSTIDYETSKAEEDECPICFSKHEKNQNKCTNCGYIY